MEATRLPSGPSGRKCSAPSPSGPPSPGGAAPPRPRCAWALRVDEEEDEESGKKMTH